ncbi:MAG: hypothetical protein PF549_03715 [Patescibacteria group bacterium]|jgi:hypothetical protein|nr:hypothetical protein [Patescibacteria group bacterium]
MNLLKKKVKIQYVFLIVLLAVIIAGIVVWFFMKEAIEEIETPPVVVKIEKRKPKIPEDFVPIERPIPDPVDMKKIKTKGCVADGLLSEYHPENEEFIDLINRSECYYMHRAIETWLKPPDFQTIDYVMSKIEKEEVVYGMFIAEAIDTKAEYFNEYEKRYFDFDAMCREGSKNVWGEHSCKPNFSHKEYRDYIKYITRKAIDLGVQSFTFGQIYMQEGGEKDYAFQIVEDIRDYAKEKGVDVIIGAQTGAIDDEKYLEHFDYIEGGVGIDDEGNVEDGPCLSRMESCWGLLWHENFSSKAENVLLHLDWSGIKEDDLDRFARMSKKDRTKTLENLYEYFTSKDRGFLMPFFGVLDKRNGGCYGPGKRFYSPDKQYSCKDEDVINEIME